MVKLSIFKRFWSIFMARNKEYFRDRAALGWNFIFPFFIILGFAAMFQRGVHDEYKCGVIPPENPKAVNELFDKTLKNPIPQVSFLDFNDKNVAFEKLRIHKLDLILERGSWPIRYWLNDNSPNGIIVESLVLRAVYDPVHLAGKAVRQTVKGDRIDYIDWLFPGIIAMNMMFSSLYGVGYVIILYRKNGTLKRLKATPLTSFEYLAAQVVSRIFLVVFSSFAVYAGCALIFKFQCKGSYLDLIFIFTLGSTSVISLAMVIASRSSSEEFANGVVNIVAWPMMFFSEVWFSIEGSPGWVHTASQFFPLTHITEGMRRIMNQGADLGSLGFEITVLLLMTTVFMTVGSLLFKWTKD